MEDQSNKRILLNLCQKIIKAKKETVEVLRNQPLCNLKMVQRKAKNIKDPNPLSSMMSTISTKFPISVDVEKARKIEMPKELLSSPDAHQYGRVMCKLEAIEWYLEKAEIPSEDVKKAIDVLYHNKRIEVSQYFSFNWRKATIVPGPTFINRMVINTQDPLVQIPNNQKTDYIMACLMPEFILNYDQLSPVVMNQLKSIRDLKLVSKMTIQSQLRLLINSLNPKPRCVPCLSESNIIINRMRHAFASSNYRIRVSHSIMGEKTSNKPVFESIGKALYMALREGCNPRKLYIRLREAEYNGEPLLMLVEREPDLEGTYVNYFLVFMNYPVLISSQIEGFRFIPTEGVAQSQRAMTIYNTPFIIYIGEEQIQIQSPYIRGFFRHNATSILGINLTKSDKNTTKAALCAIAEYCRFNFNFMQGKNIREIKRNARNYYSLKPWEIIGVNQDDWNSVLKHESKGKLKFEEEIEIMPGNKQQGTIEKEKIRFKTGHVVTVNPPLEKPMFTQNLVIRGIEFSDFDVPKRRLTTKLEYFVFNINLVKEYISKGIFNWLNKSMMDGVPGPQRVAVATAAQSVLINSYQEEVSPLLLAFLYLFAGEDIKNVNPNIVINDFTWFNNFQVSFTFDKGIFKFVDQWIMLFDKKFQPAKQEEVDKYLPCFLTGYSFLNCQDETREFKSVEHLRNKESEIRSGTLFNISLFGRTYLVRRDPIAKYALKKTIMRNMASVSTQGVLEAMLRISRIQKRSGDQLEEPGCSKKARLIEERVMLEDPFMVTGDDDPNDDNDEDFDDL
uniref:PA n=1 Tax=Jingshan Fly Virus 1 TaxID=1608053 RepID=A0A1L3KKN8_9ORTO|nr:polymerase PB2 [Jingshan Fly Virus 1]APG77899.1 PA [Jingshan Fly Virus 1]